MTGNVKSHLSNLQRFWLTQFDFLSPKTLSFVPWQVVWSAGGLRAHFQCVNVAWCPGAVVIHSSCFSASSLPKSLQFVAKVIFFCCFYLQKLAENVPVLQFPPQQKRWLQRFQPLTTSELKAEEFCCPSWSTLPCPPLPTWTNWQIDHGWRSLGGAQRSKTHKAAFFGFLLPGAPKVPLQHPPVAQRIDGALLMAQHLLASARSVKTFSYAAQTRGWSLFFPQRSHPLFSRSHLRM